MPWEMKRKVKIIYVELTFCNYFTDIDYEKVIPEEYLPIGFDAKVNNPAHSEFKAKIDRTANGESLPEDTEADIKADKTDQADLAEESSHESVSADSDE